MWPAECVYCNTIRPNPVLWHCCWCCFCMAALVKSWVHLRKVCGQSIRWPHDNLRFLRHARKPAPVHVIMHNLPECLPPFSTNCSLLTALPSIIASVVLFAMLLLHRNELHTWVEGEIVCNPLQAFHHPRYNERHCDHQGWEQMILRIRYLMKMKKCLWSCWLSLFFFSASSTLLGQFWPAGHCSVLRLLLLAHLLYRLRQLRQCRAKPPSKGGAQGSEGRTGRGETWIGRQNNI